MKIRPAALFTLLLLARTLSAGTVLEGVYSPDMLLVGENHLYVVEGWRIKIFDRRNGRWIRSFGRRGEGPGEFNGFIIPSLIPGGLLVNCPTRVLYFDREGKFLRERRSLKVFGRFKPAGKNFVGYRYLNEKGVRYETICLFSENFHPVRELYRRRYIRQADGSTDLVDERPPFFYVYRDRIYLDGIEGDIHVFNQQGEPLGRVVGTRTKTLLTRRRIRAMEEKLKRDRRTREYYLANKDKFIWPQYQPMIRMFYLADGRFYIVTSRERNGRSEMLIRDRDGTLLGRTFVTVTSFPQALLSGIHEGRFYHLLENPDGDWELQVTDLMHPAR